MQSGSHFYDTHNGNQKIFHERGTDIHPHVRADFVEKDSICFTKDVPGCTESSACNYNAAATSDDGSCTYAEANKDCDANCINDKNGNGICDEEEVDGQYGDWKAWSECSKECGGGTKERSRACDSP